MNANTRNNQRRNNCINYAQIGQPYFENEENVDDEYQIQYIERHRFKENGESNLSLRQIQFLQKPLTEIPDNELQFLVKQAGQYQLSWQSGQNLKNTPQILQSYKTFYSTEKSMSTIKTTTGTKRDRKFKCELTGKGNRKCQKIKSHSFYFGKAHQKSNQGIQSNEEDDDNDLQIIDKETYVRGVREMSEVKAVQNIRRKEIQTQNFYLEVQLLKPHSEWPYVANSIIREGKSADKQNEELNQGRENQRTQENQQLNVQNFKKQTDFQAQNNSKPIKINALNQSKELTSNSLIYQFTESHPIQPRQSNDRSLMSTQQQKTLEMEHKSLEPLSLIQEEEQRSEQKSFYQEAMSSKCERLIDLFLQKNATSKQIENITAIEKNNQETELQRPIERHITQLPSKNSNILPQQQVDFNKKNTSPKRSLQDIGPQQLGLDKPSKRAKKLEEEKTDHLHSQHQFSESSGLGSKSHKDPIVIEIQEDQILYFPQFQPNHPIVLREKIQNELHNLLNKEKVNFDEILINKQPSIDEPIKKINEILSIKVAKNYCAGCRTHEQYNNQLRLLFNQSLSSQQQINLDNLFLEQQTICILSTLNPTPENSSLQKYIRVDKMADISKNETLCTLILRKIAKREDLQRILHNYSISKLLKIEQEWFGIFQIKPNGHGRQGKFKYVRATQILELSRETIVSFLMK